MNTIYYLFPLQPILGVTNNMGPSFEYVYHNIMFQPYPNVLGSYENDHRLFVSFELQKIAMGKNPLASS